MRKAAALAAILALLSARSEAESFDCLIQPSLAVKVGSPVAGIVASINVDRGARVKAGQVLAHLDSAVEDATVDFDRAKAESTADIMAKAARVTQANADLSRGQHLQEGLSVTSQKLDELRMNFAVAQQDLVLANLNHKLAQLDLARAQATAEQRVIRSPIDGVVTQRALGPGEFVHENTFVVSVAAVDPLYVEAYPPVGYFSHVHVGDAATVRANLPNAPDRPATVSVVDEVFDPASGTFGLRLTMPNPGNASPAGLRCSVTFPDVVAQANDPRPGSPQPSWKSGIATNSAP